MKRLLVLLLFTFFIDCSPPPIFSTLSELQQYAKTMDEYPPIDNTTWANPDYTTFLRRQVPSYWDVLSYKLHLRSWPLWNVHGFSDLLKKVVKKRENNGYIDRFILKMKPLTGSSYIIWGDVQGAFHSLVRVLSDLHKQGIINDNLEIVRPYIYFIFNGDLVNRSAYSLEALTVVMRLMDRNAGKVFYIRGNHEDHDHWRNFNLKRDLVIRASSFSNEEVPLGSDVSRFFDTLPLSLYLIGPEDDKSINVVRISHYGRSRLELDEEKFSGFFQGPHAQKATVFKLNNKIEDSKKRVNIRAIVRGESRSTVYRPTPGMSQLEADKGATAWTLLSSPIESYRYLQDFYFDAFGVLDVGKTLNDWTITLYNQDVRELLGFKKVAVYNLITGLREFKAEKNTVDLDPFVVLGKQLKKVDQETKELQKGCSAAAKASLILERETPQVVKKNAPLVSKTRRIIFGSTLDLSGPIKKIGKHVEAGLKLAIDEVNEDEGVHGKRIQLIILDDAYKPEQAKDNINILRNQYNTGNILAPSGTVTLKAYLDLVKAGQVLVLFPITGSMIFRKPDLKHIVNLRASDNDTVHVVARYMVDTLGINKMAIVYQDDDYGKGGLQAVKEILQARNMSDWKEISYNPNISDFAHSVEQLQAYDADGVIFIATPLMVKNIIKQLGVGFFEGKHLGGTSDMAEEEFQDLIHEKGLSFIVGDVLPDAHKSSLPIVKEFRKKAKEKNIKIDAFALEAFINAKLLVHVLKNIRDDVTQERLIEEIENIEDFDFGGLHLSFDKQKRQLLHSVWLNKGSGEWTKIDLKE